MCRNYQGWSNYPSWVVALWIDNNEWMHTYSIEIASDWVDDDEGLAIQRIADSLEEWIGTEIYDHMPNLGVANDLLNFAFDMVEWRELARHYLEIAKENEA